MSKSKQLNGLPWRLYSDKDMEFARHGNNHQELKFFTKVGATAANTCSDILQGWDSTQWRVVNVESRRWKLKEFWWRVRFMWYHDRFTAWGITGSWAAATAASFPCGQSPRDAALEEVSYYTDDGGDDAHKDSWGW